MHKEINSFVENFIQEDLPRFLNKLEKDSNSKRNKLNKFLKTSDFKFGFKMIATKTVRILILNYANFCL